MKSIPITRTLIWMIFLLSAAPLLGQTLSPTPPMFLERQLEAVIDHKHSGMIGARSAIITSNTGGSPFEGLEVNQLIGAERFYDNGYTGTRAIIANIEAGHLWDEHETMQHVLDFFDAREKYIDNNVGFGQLGEPDRHATWVSQAIGGTTADNFSYQTGIAFDAELWSGAIATTYLGGPFTTAFAWSRGLRVNGRLFFADTCWRGRSGR